MGLKPVRVAQLNNYIGRVLKTDPILGNVSVVGEVSNLKFHSSGHVYFSLKDEDSKINCFLAAGNLQRITCPLDEGMEIVATGYISVYERGGYYSLNIRDIEVNGEGQLAIQFEKLKEKLNREGLFDNSVKKALPFFPEKVAVVTSETGAAVRDIIRTIKNKNNYVDIMVYPVLVQGTQAAADIADAINDINSSHKDVSVIITGRGGGSMEELWAFNEEIVARSIFSSEIPVISAVGHETDFTIADFVADYRAATPTAAAEAAVPDIEELKEEIEYYRKSLKEDLLRYIEMKSAILESLNPQAFAQSIASRIDYEQMNTDRIIENMAESLQDRLKWGRERIEMLKEIIEASNPKSILKRGYSVITDIDGNIINSTSKLKEGSLISIETSDGGAKAEVTEILNGGK